MSVDDPLALLRNLCSQPHEQEWLEFKVSYFDHMEIGRYVSALANAAMLSNETHGYLVFGVENETHNIVGTEVRLKSKKVGNEPFEHWLARALDPRLQLEFIECNDGGRYISIIKIDPAYQRPVSFKQVQYIRVGSVTKPLHEHWERARTLWAATSRLSFEQGIARGHVAGETIQSDFACRELFGLLDRPVRSRGEIIDGLLTEQLIVDNRQGRFDVTNLFALLAANNLDSFPLLRDKAPRVVIYDGTSRLVGKGIDVTGRLGYAAAFQKLLKFVMGHVPKREVMDMGVRETQYVYPEIAVRELLANALIHQDFSISGSGPTIEVFDDRMQITNLGKPIVSIDRFIDTPSRSRNQRLARMMRDLKLCEERGSGIDRALGAIEALSLPPPLFAIVEESTTATLFAEKTFAAMQKNDRLRACYQHACLRHQANDPMSNGSLRMRLGLHTSQSSQVSRLIAEALEAGLIATLEDEQPNRLARYVPWWAKPADM